MKKRSCTAFLAACALAVFAGSARSEDDSEEKKVTVSLAEVRAFPEAYRRVPFDVELLYHGPRSIYNPFFTIFEPSTYANFAAWSGDAAIFRREEYVDDHPLFYVERRNEGLQRQLMAMRPYTWMVARCIVRSVAQDRAWIEVLSIPTVGASLDPSDLRHLVRGHALSTIGETERAMVEMEMARLFQVPPRFVARCRLEEGRIALAGNQPERALIALQQAWTQLPEDKQLTRLIDRASAQVAMLRQGEISGTPVTVPPQKPANGDGPPPGWVPQADGPNAPKSTTPADPAAPPKDAPPGWTPKDDAQPAAPKSTTPADPQAPAKESTPAWTPKDDAQPAAPKSTTPAEAPAKPTQEPWVPADPATPPAAKPSETTPPADPSKPSEKPADKPAEKPADKPADPPSDKPADPPQSDDDVPPPSSPDPSDDGSDGSDGG